MVASPASTTIDWTAAAFCLRGEVGGADHTHPLPPGLHTVGSSRSSDVFLPAHGVSRRHAALDVSADRVTVKDLGSKNGTRVDERDVGTDPQGARVEIGGLLSFGPVTLRLQSMAMADAVLGLQLEDPSDPASGSPDGETSRFEQDPRDPFAPGYPGLLATLVDLLAPPAPDVQAAIHSLADALDVSGVALLEGRSGGTPAVLASAGDLALEGFRLGLTAPRGRAAFERIDEEGLCGFVHCPRPPGVPRALVARPGAEGVAPMALLEAALRIIDRLDLPTPPMPDERRGEAPGGATPELRFPERIFPGRSPAMLELYRQMRLLLRGDLPVLILGETGVGKEHVAATLHRSSDRASGPFVAINCAAIPADLLEAEMFGIGRGVATGVEARTGDILRAHGGTLFLDEIGEIPLALQAKLLRVLQEKQVRPIGLESRPVDVRLVAATNVDLRERIRRGGFREDLFFRLAGFELEVPPLRKRREDLAPLVATFLERYAAEAGTRIRGVSVRALAALSAYDWPGNVRELQHEIRRCVYRCPEGQAIGTSRLTPGILGGPASDADLEALPEPQPSGEGGEPSTMSLEERVDELQRRLIRRALAATGGNQTQAAKRLAVSRSGLIKRMKRLRIDPAQ